MLWAIEFPSSQSVDEREHSVGEACRRAWIVLRDVLHARLKVPRGPSVRRRFSTLQCPAYRAAHFLC